MATKKKAKCAAKPKRDPRLPKVGTTISRKFKTKTYKLRVTKDGFALGKRKFKSLTAAAKHVTGYPSVSGVRFWLGMAGKDGA